MAALDAVHPDRFREALGAVCTPVSVVTSCHRGRPHGTTVSAFCSLSLSPPLILVALDRGSDLLAMVTESRAYAVNVLGHGQEELARRFARKGVDKFEGVEWELEEGLPRLAGAASWLRCRLEDLHEGGDHLVAVGLVEHAEGGDGDPLLYRRRAFGTLARLGTDAAGTTAQTPEASR